MRISERRIRALEVKKENKRLLMIHKQEDGKNDVWITADGMEHKTLPKGMTERQFLTVNYV